MAACTVAAIGPVDEHRDRPARESRDLEHLLERVAARVLEIDQDDVGIDAVDARQEIRHVADVVDLERAAGSIVIRDAQAVLEDGCPNCVLVDNENSQ